MANSTATKAASHNSRRRNFGGRSSLDVMLQLSLTRRVAGGPSFTQQAMRQKSTDSDAVPSLARNQAWRYGRFLGFWLRVAYLAAWIRACRDAARAPLRLPPVAVRLLLRASRDP